MNISELPDVLTIDEAARLLRIGRNTAYSMAKKGMLPSLTMGRRILVPKRALEVLLGGHSQTGDGVCAA